MFPKPRDYSVRELPDDAPLSHLITELVADFYMLGIPGEAITQGQSPEEALASYVVCRMLALATADLAWCHRSLSEACPPDDLGTALEAARSWLALPEHRYPEVG